MVKMEIELTDEQFERFEILKSKGVDVGQAIDLLFGIQGEIISQVEEQENEKNLLEKISDTNYDVEIKQQLLKKNYQKDKTSDRAIRDTKQNLKWSKFFEL
ncbi:hypothetical protein [uncultured Methanobrevibacter sp.]|uniref:hypothetical protein n=1 Tax=uncultured Methanobrevibacter sp. TaxID=253161 RepID=UPI002635479C|nr:hypothetical protein [uncultured Methanobrevibacter sp.]